MVTVYNDIYSIPAEAKGCVLTIGNFDGVHKGHQRLLKTARTLADELDTKLVAMVFSPHSRKFFNPDIRPFYITPFETKKQLLADMGVDIIFNVNFDLMFASMSYHEFILRILIEGLQTKHLVVGEGFTFGSKKSGGINQLQQAASEGGFDFTVEQDLKDDVSLNSVSSFAIREFLREGNFIGAQNLLGREWFIEGKVIKGSGEENKLGFVTANISAKEYVFIPFGVYATKVLIEGEKDYRNSITCFGVNLALKELSPLAETHIFDYDENLIDKKIKIFFKGYIRGERMFNSIEEHIATIKTDCEKAKQLLQRED